VEVSSFRLAIAPCDAISALATKRFQLYILAMLYIELAIVIVLILVNGVLALAELALVSPGAPG
jgi:hypothetical protein